MTAQITGPACTFNADALRNLLAEPSKTETHATYAEELGVADFDVTLTEDLTSALDDVLDALVDDDEQDALTLADGVDDLEIYRVYDGSGGCDGVVVVVTMTSGAREVSLHQDHKQIAGSIETPIEAIVEAVGAVARLANEVVRRYREAQVDLVRDYREALGTVAGEVTGHEVIVFVTSDEQIRALETALGVRAGALGAFDERTKSLGRTFDRQFDLGKAVAFARDYNLHYVEVRETTYDSRT